MLEMLNRAQLDGRILEMIYMAQNGIISQRKIKVIRVEEERILAYCFLRKMNRTFNVSQILSIIPANLIKRSIG